MEDTDYNTSPLDENTSMGASVGRGVREFADRPNMLGSILNNGPLSGGLLGGAIGAGIGGLAGIPTRRSKRLAVIAGLLGAGLGAGLGAYSGMVRQPGYYKSAAWRGGDPFGDPTDQILTALQSDTGLGTYQKMQMMAQVAQLPQYQAAQLAQMLGSVAGAGVGALIARFLLGAGTLGTAVGAGMGYMAGNALFGNHQRDAMGYPSSDQSFTNSF